MSLFDRLRTQKLLSFTLTVFTLSIGIVIGTLITGGVKAAKDDKAAPGATPLVIPNPVELSNAFTQIAKSVEPSVVNISTTYLPKQPQRGSMGRRPTVVPRDQGGDQGGDGGGMDDFLYHFFGNPNGDGSGGSSRKQEALGSGVVVDKAGYILTNNHVVDKADIIKVKFAGDSTEYTAKVVGVDSQTDLAVIHVEGKHEVTPAKIGNSDAVQVGDWAMAIGSPFGFQATVTAGIISAKERDIPGDTTQYQHFLQTDAAINPGNSGGPLLNMRGEVIGINTAIASQSGGYQGIGFALPINTAAGVYNQIIKTGKMTRGSIGITYSPQEQQNNALLRAEKVNEGVFIQSVQPGGPAEKAGIKETDIIVAVNGKPVRNGNELVNIVSVTPVGSPLDLTVVRGGKRENFKVVVGDLSQIFPERFAGNKESEQTTPEATTVSFGMSIQNLSEQQRTNLGVKEKGGVQVVEVDPDSFAEEVGLLQGDVILSLNRQPVNSTEDIKKIQATLKPGDAVAFHVIRKLRGRGGDWQSSYLAGTLSTNPR
ncbi:MAG TPA: Do family serine endopeptidase [Candidatus Sulfopaludibacter sp.]|jgi:serine protease Do|nr:Do family serine endopeptidase [Candidatus Sulfopaludibacter sp.]